MYEEPCDRLWCEGEFTFFRPSLTNQLADLEITLWVNQIAVCRIEMYNILMSICFKIINCALACPHWQIVICDQRRATSHLMSSHVSNAHAPANVTSSFAYVVCFALHTSTLQLVHS